MTSNVESSPAAPAMAPAIHQGELFELADVEGYSVLTRRERLFAAAIFEGCTQREAARRAGVTGSDEVIDVTASRIIRSPQVQRLLDQAWLRAAGDISQTLREAEEVRRRAYREIIDAPTSKRGKDALEQWKIAASLIASIHGKLSLRVEGQINHHHGGAVAAVVVPAEALPAMAQMRRELIRERMENSDKTSQVIDVQATGGQAAFR